MATARTGPGSEVAVQVAVLRTGDVTLLIGSPPVAGVAEARPAVDQPRLTAELPQGFKIDQRSVHAARILFRAADSNRLH